MSLPGVSILLANGALGGIGPSADRVRGLVVSATAGAVGLALGVATVIYSLADAKALGIVEAGDTAFAYRQLKEFYDAAGPTSELWIMLVPETATFATMAESTNASGAIKLIEKAAGRIRALGIALYPAASYSAILTHGIDAGSLDGITPAQVLGEACAARQMPLRILLEGRLFAAAGAASLEDLRQRAANRVGIVTFSSSNDGTASVGAVLGRSAAGTLARNIGRVKSGPMPFDGGFNGSVPAGPDGVTAALHDKGYIAARKFVGRNGVFISDDPTCAPASDDYSSLSRGLVIDAAQRIAYDVYTNEVNDDTEFEAGKIHPAVIATLQSDIVTRISREMGGSISGVKCFIDPDQPVVSAGQLKAQLRVEPRGYFKDILVDLGFSLPS